MQKIAVISFFLMGSTFALPIPEVKDLDNQESGSKAIFSLFSQLAVVMQKTGDVISQLSRNYTDMTELTQAGEKISKAGEELPGDFNDIVQDNFKMLLEILPTIKHNITEAMNQLPGIRERISDNIDMLPTKDDIIENAEPLLEALGLFVADDDVEDILSRIDSIPSKDYIDENIQMALDNIPSADYVNSRVDDFVDQVSPIIEELKETGGRK